MKLTTHLAFLIFTSVWISSPILVHGQITVFEKTYNYDFSEVANDVEQTADGGFILVGEQGVTIGQTRIFMTKTDSLGIEEWHQFYGGPYSNRGRSVCQSPDGGYLFVGNTSGEEVIGTQNKLFVVRTDVLGDTLWTHIFGNGTFPDNGLDVKLMDDSTYQILGIIQSHNPDGKADIYLFNMNDMGEVLWESIIGDSEVHDTASKFEVLDDGSFILVGNRQVSGAQNDALIVKTDSIGNLIWAKSYGWENSENAQDIKVTSTGELMVLAGTASFNSYLANDLYLLKLDSEGDTIWTKVHLGEGESEETALAMVRQGDDFILAGYNHNEQEIYGKIQLQKIDANGDILWKKRLGGENDNVWSIIKTFDNGLALSGSKSSGCFSCAYLIKTNDEGSLVSLAPPILANEVIGFDLYPNPSSGLVNISSTFESPFGIRWKLVDVTGRKWPVNIAKVLGKINTFQVDLSNFPKGIYFIQSVSPNSKTSSKMILLQ